MSMIHPENAQAIKHEHFFLISL